MTGPDHYQQAETAISQANHEIQRHQDHDAASSYLALAQVHATLALAAATALPSVRMLSAADFKAWAAAAGLLASEFDGQ